MRGKSLSDSQPVRRFLHFVIQHEFLKKEHSPKFLHDHSHSQHFDGTFILFFICFFSGNFGVRQVMSELNVIATEMKVDVLEAEEADAMDAEAAAEHTKKREEKVTRNLRRVSPGSSVEQEVPLKIRRKKHLRIR